MGITNIVSSSQDKLPNKSKHRSHHKKKLHAGINAETVSRIKDELLIARQNIEANSINPSHTKRNFKEMFDYHFPHLKKTGQSRTQEGLLIETSHQYEMTYSEVMQSPDQLRTRLRENGLVIITDVINEKKNAKMVKSYIQDFQNLIDPTHYVNGVPPHPSSIPPKGWGGKTILSENGMPCTKNAQKRRLNGRVRGIFSTLYGISPDELITSLEGPAVQFSKWVKQKGGQSTNGMSNAAAMICAMCGKNQAPIHCINTYGLVGKPLKKLSKSNLLFTDPVFGAIINQDQDVKVLNEGKSNQKYVTSPGLIFCPNRDPTDCDNGTELNHWSTFTTSQLMKIIPDLIFPKIPAGSVVLWRGDIPFNDSLGHKGYLSEVDDTSIVRACQYVTWFPRAFVSPKIIQTRINSAYQGIGDRGNFPGAFFPASKGRHRSNTNGDWKVTIDQEKRQISDDMLQSLGANIQSIQDYEKNMQ